mgnify:CR=1 FL=1
MNKLKISSAILALSIILSVCPAYANVWNPERLNVYMQDSWDGRQSWAYYPYNGNTASLNWSGTYNGTGYFIVEPGTSILRKLIIHNALPENDTFIINVTGIDPSWVSFDPPGSETSLIVSAKYHPSHWSNYTPYTHEGYKSIIITPPPGTPPGIYRYYVNVTSKSYPSYSDRLHSRYNNTTYEGDLLVVGYNGSAPTVSPTANPSVSPTASPSVSPTASASVSPTALPSPRPGYSVDLQHKNLVLYDSKWVPVDTTVYDAGKRVNLGLNIRNNGSFSDSYAVSVTGIPSDWYTITQLGFPQVLPAGTQYGSVDIYPVYNGSYPVRVSVISPNGAYDEESYTINVNGPAEPTSTPTPVASVTPTPSAEPSVSPTATPVPDAYGFVRADAPSSPTENDVKGSLTGKVQTYANAGAGYALVYVIDADEYGARSQNHDVAVHRYYDTTADENGNYQITGLNNTLYDNGTIGKRYVVYANHSLYGDGYSSPFGITSGNTSVVPVVIFSLPSAISMAASNSTLIADGLSKVNISAYVTDAAGSPVADGYPVVFSLGSMSGSGNGVLIDSSNAVSATSSIEAYTHGGYAYVWFGQATGAGWTNITATYNGKSTIGSTVTIDRVNNSTVIPTSTPTPTPPSNTITPTPVPSTQPGYGADLEHKSMIKYNGTWKTITATVESGGHVNLGIAIKNTGIYEDNYTVYVSGLPPDWHTVTMWGTANVNPGSIKYGSLDIYPKYGGIFAYNITAVSSHGAYDTESYVLNVGGQAPAITPTPGVTVTPVPVVSPSPVPSPSPSPSPAPSPGPSPSPSPSISPSPDPGNLLADPGFESGNEGAWPLWGKIGNWNKGHTYVQSNVVHSGNNALATDAYLYGRLGQAVPFNNGVFSYSYYFYVNMSGNSGGSVWGGVTGNPLDMDDVLSTRAIGYNKKASTAGEFQCVYWVGSGNPSYIPIYAGSMPSGWYKGVIEYYGSTLHYSVYDSSGNRVGNEVMFYDPGFTPRAAIVNVACPDYYVDDVSYKTG